MTEPGRVDRGSRPEPSGPKKKKGVDSDAFKEMMKVGKVRETDPEEKKKKKSQAEAEEEAKTQQAEPPLKQGLGGPGPAEPPLGGAEFKPPPSKTPGEAPPSAPAPPSQPPPFFPPASDEGEEPSTGAITPKKRTEATQAPQPTTKKKEAEKKDKKKEEVVLPTEAPKKEVKTPLTAKKGVKGIEKGDEKQTDAFFAQMGAAPPTPEEEKKAAEELQAPPPVLPEGAWEAGTKEPEKKDQKITQVEGEQGLQSEMQLGAGAAPPAAAAPAPVTSPFANLPPQIQAIFEKMVGVMTVMDAGGIKETTINLTASQYEKSIFYGTQIVLTEFSTAPKEFNIEMIGNQRAMDLVGTNSNELVAAFAAGNYNFKVHRVDTSIAPSRATAKKEAQKVKRKKEGGK